MQRFAVLVIAVACGSICGCGGSDTDTPTPPVIVLDQSVVPNPPTLVLPVGPTDCAQTFRVGRTGRLVRIEVLLSATMIPVAGTLRIDIRPTNAGNPVEDDNLALGFVDLDTANLPIMPVLVSLEFYAQNIQVQNNQRLAIVARRVSGIDIVAQIHGSGADIYGNGTIVRRPGGGTWGQTTGDIGFRTFVEPAP